MLAVPLLLLLLLLLLLQMRLDLFRVCRPTSLDFPPKVVSLRRKIFIPFYTNKIEVVDFSTRRRSRRRRKRLDCWRLVDDVFGGEKNVGFECRIVFDSLCHILFRFFWSCSDVFQRSRSSGVPYNNKTKKQRDMIIENVEDDIEMDEICVQKKRLTRLMRVKTKSRKAKKYFWSFGEATRVKWTKS